MLHAKELMIGDWVKFPGGAIDKVVDMPYIEGKGICVSFAASATLFPFPISKIEPIPITPEILEKNGFSQDPLNGHIFIFHEKPGVVIYYESGLKYGLTIDNQLATIQDLKINHIHELQHALRLCGIEKEIEL